MPAMTDTVMAAVPERDAGVGSALNDVSRQLGGALGVAIIGSVVNDAYRSNLADHAGDLDPGVVHAAGEGIGVASSVAATLPPEGAAELTRAANEAYVDAIARGFTVSVAVLVAALVVAVTMIPAGCARPRPRRPTTPARWRPATATAVLLRRRRMRRAGRSRGIAGDLAANCARQVCGRRSGPVRRRRAGPAGPSRPQRRGPGRSGGRAPARRTR